MTMKLFTRALTGPLGGQATCPSQTSLVPKSTFSYSYREDPGMRVRITPGLPPSKFSGLVNIDEFWAAPWIGLGNRLPSLISSSSWHHGGLIPENPRTRRVLRNILYACSSTQLLSPGGQQRSRFGLSFDAEMQKSGHFLMANALCCDAPHAGEREGLGKLGLAHTRLQGSHDRSVSEWRGESLLTTSPYPHRH